MSNATRTVKNLRSDIPYRKSLKDDNFFDACPDIENVTSVELLKKTQVLSKVHDMRKILKVRKIFGTAGASLTWGVEGATKNEVGAGLLGERTTGDVLNEIVKTNSGFYVFHSISSPYGRGDTDHALIYGNTVFVIDSKMWKSRRTYVVTPRGKVLRGTVRFEGGDVNMKRSVALWKSVLPTTCRVIGLVCIAQTNVQVQRDDNWEKAPFTLTPLKDLPRTIFSALESESGKISFGCEVAAYYMMMNVIKPNPDRASTLL